MVVHFESVRLKKMSMNLENLAEMMSPTCFENITRTHARVLYSITRLMVVHFQLVRLKKDEYDS